MISNCKFCGSANVMADVKISKIDNSNMRYTHYVRCKNCHARGPAIKANQLSSKDKQKAVATWNGNIQGDVMTDKITERLQEEVEHSEWLTDRLKCVAKSIEFLNLPQPEECLFGYGGSCCYPIYDCLNCPCHPWNDEYMPLTSCEFK